MAAIKLTRSHRILVVIVLAGAVVIAAIGFAGSYASVRDLAERKGFGDFAPFFPIGIDAGIVVLLALDLLLTWLRIPFPMLRQCAWLLTAATIAFNGASAWGDPLAVSMHGIIPVLFVITVEAARHAIGRVADITADKHMEGVRMWRWFLSPIPTFRLWRRMKLWELRSYEEVIGMERDRLVYQARLRADYGRAWRRRAPVEARMPLKLARYGVPLRETAPAGLAAAGLPVAELPPRAPEPDPDPARAPERAAPPTPEPTPAPQPEPAPPAFAEQAWFTAEPQPPAPGAQEQPPAPAVTVPVVGPGGRRRSLGSAPANGYPVPQQRQLLVESPPDEPEPVPTPAPEPLPDPVGPAEGLPSGDDLYPAYREYILEQGAHPNARQLSRFLHSRYGTTDADGSLLSEPYLREFTRQFRQRYNAEMGTNG
ncbi:DUF2637 domain-containing protein [Streptomyces radicis]|uniref:DUF2637 domain-containing protein n=1 Tax=Streptomyces radicis TaxID=1750517 RepID=A0A3A9W9P7_9ACTN|nr:DUF2637 domain-containing protein [Streptomyces radicis]RKN09795.1 DUF2637 domain-containing protein [Streptomyces radicis]RKN23432.1 DUF2637 domain-containing protein [Streptomyces radicis]